MKADVRSAGDSTGRANCIRIEHLTVYQDHSRLPQVSHVVRGISIHQHQVGRFAYRDRAGLAVSPHQAGRDDSSLFFHRKMDLRFFFGIACVLWIHFLRLLCLLIG